MRHERAEEPAEGQARYQMEFWEAGSPREEGGGLSPWLGATHGPEAGPTEHLGTAPQALQLHLSQLGVYLFPDVPRDQREPLG